MPRSPRLVGSETLVTAPTSDTLDLALTPIDSANLSGLLTQGPAVQQAEAQLPRVARRVWIRLWR